MVLDGGEWYMHKIVTFYFLEVNFFIREKKFSAHFEIFLFLYIFFVFFLKK